MVERTDAGIALQAAGHSPPRLRDRLSSYGRAKFNDVYFSKVISYRKTTMGRGILLWMLGVPLPIILLLAMCSHY